MAAELFVGAHLREQSTETDKAALEAFVSGNNELVELEALLTRFNIFEALGVTTRELNHSRFLGFLLDPAESHGLGDIFLKRFLQTALKNIKKSDISPIEIDSDDLTQSEVKFEYENIDVFIFNQEKKVAIVIENKTNSQEHSNQLQKYHDFIKHRFPQYRFLGIYITRERSQSSHSAFVAVSHEDIKAVVAEVIQRPGLNLNSVVSMAINQYLEVLRRHFMQDSEIAELCGKIYRRHKHAIDLIIANKPDKRDFVQKVVLGLISNEKTLTLDDSTRPYIRFASKALDHPFLKNAEEEWTTSRRLALYEFRNGLNSLSLIVQLGRGEQAKRKQILEMAQNHGKPFKPEKKLYTLWNRLYKIDMLDESDYDLAEDEIKNKIKEKWDEFLQIDYPAIEKAFTNYPWPTQQ